jgi:hypothetical protein
MPKLSRSLAVLAAGAALLAAGFPAKTVPPERFAKSICTTVTDWIDEIVELGGDYDGQVGSTPDLDERKDLTIEFLDGALDSTDTLIRRVKKAGTPDVDDGKAVVKVYRRGFRDARDVLEEAATEAEDLRTGDEGEFQAALAELGTAVEEGFADVGDAISRAEQDFDRELRAAFEDEPACAELANVTGEVGGGGGA